MHVKLMQLKKSSDEKGRKKDGNELMKVNYQDRIGMIIKNDHKFIQKDA